MLVLYGEALVLAGDLCQRLNACLDKVFAADLAVDSIDDHSRFAVQPKHPQLNGESFHLLTMYRGLVSFFDFCDLITGDQMTHNTVLGMGLDAPFDAMAAELLGVWKALLEMFREPK